MQGAGWGAREWRGNEKEERRSKYLQQIFDCAAAWSLDLEVCVQTRQCVTHGQRADALLETPPQILCTIRQLPLTGVTPVTQTATHTHSWVQIPQSAHTPDWAAAKGGEGGSVQESFTAGQKEKRTTQWEAICAHSSTENEVIVCFPCKAVMQAISICIKRETGATFVLPTWHLWHLDFCCRSFTGEGDKSRSDLQVLLLLHEVHNQVPLSVWTAHLFSFQIATGLMGSHRWSEFSTCWTKRELLIIRASQRAPENQTRECFYPESKQQFQFNILFVSFSFTHSFSTTNHPAPGVRDGAGDFTAHVRQRWVHTTHKFIAQLRILLNFFQFYCCCFFLHLLLVTFVMKENFEKRNSQQGLSWPLHMLYISIISLKVNFQNFRLQSVEVGLHGFSNLLQ